MSEQRPPRVRIESPRRSAVRAAKPRAVTREIDEQTHVGEVYMRSLVKTQLRLGLGICSVFMVLLGGLPLLLSLSPGLTHDEVFGIPLPWLLLGVLVHPVLIAGGWFYIRAAERTERDFADLVEGS